MSTRPAAVAGYFYEADSKRLQDHVNQLLAAAPAEPGSLPEGLIVPHAGYVYSGSTAASAYRCLAPDRGQVKRVLLLGPAHRVYVAGMAIPSVDRFATPLGEIELDRAGLEQIRQLPGVEISDEAHRDEHSLEVQLPFLQTVLDDFTLLPVVVGGADAETVAAVVDALGEDPATLVVVSSDLSHFHDYDAARRIDGRTCEQILDHATTLRDAIRPLIARAVRLIRTCNSGDTAGSRDRVVGYAAFALH